MDDGCGGNRRLGNPHPGGFFDVAHGLQDDGGWPTRASSIEHAEVASQKLRLW
jgi:hypothetical protein